LKSKNINIQDATGVKRSKMDFTLIVECLNINSNILIP